MAVIVPRVRLVERRILRSVSVVVNHVHYNAYAPLVRRLDKLLELPYPYLAVVGIGGIAALGNIVVQRVVAPVEARVRVAFVHRLIVGHRQQVDMSYPQLLYVVKTDSLSESVDRLLAERPELPAQREVPALVGGKIPDVQFVYHRVGVVAEGDLPVTLPALRVGGTEIKNHSAPAVYTGASRVYVDSFSGVSIPGECICVVHPAEIAGNLRLPHAVLAVHFFGAERLRLGVVMVQPEFRALGLRRPHREPGRFGRPDRAKLAVVCVFPVDIIKVVHTFTPNHFKNTMLCGGISSSPESEGSSPADTARYPRTLRLSSSRAASESDAASSERL